MTEYLPIIASDYSPWEDWKPILTAPLAAVNCAIKAGDKELKFEAPQPLPKNCVIRIVPEPMQPNFLEPKIKQLPDNRTVLFTLPLALPTNIRFQAVIFGYTDQQVESLKRYAVWIAKQLGENNDTVQSGHEVPQV